MIHPPEQPLPHPFTTIVADHEQRTDDQPKRTHDNPRPRVSHGKFLSIAEIRSSFRNGIRSDSDRTAHHACRITAALGSKAFDARVTHRIRAAALRTE
jgi:hypothetical protein